MAVSWLINGGFIVDVQYLEDHPRTCKWLVINPHLQAMKRPFRRGISPLTNWDDPPSTLRLKRFFHMESLNGPI